MFWNKFRKGGRCWGSQSHPPAHVGGHTRCDSSSPLVGPFSSILSREPPRVSAMASTQTNLQVSLRPPPHGEPEPRGSAGRDGGWGGSSRAPGSGRRRAAPLPSLGWGGPAPPPCFGVPGAHLAAVDLASRTPGPRGQFDAKDQHGIPVLNPCLNLASHSLKCIYWVPGWRTCSTQDH